jgi:hypothetical protein
MNGTLTAGFLEAAVMAMHCKAAGKSEAELKSRLNEHQRQGLKKAVKSLDWPDDKKIALGKRLAEIAALDKRRNALIHVAAGIVSNNSILGIPAGSAINFRAYGIGVIDSEDDSRRIGRVTNSDGDSWTIGLVATKIDVDEIDKLIDDIQQAQRGLVPYMELVDKITHPAKSAEELVDRLKNRKLPS